MPDAPAPPARLRVVTWNIRAAIGPGEPFPPAWWRHVRDDRLERIGAMIRDLDPDIATLQEVAVLTPDGRLIDQPAELARLTGRHVRYAAVHAFPLVEPETGRAIGMASWGNAILSREPLADGFALGLPRASDDDVVELDGAVDPHRGGPHPLIGVRYGDAEPGHREPRCIVGGRFRDVTVATAHLTYIGRAQRATQAAALARELADRSDAGPAILTGDFNAPIDAPELAALAGDGFIDAFAGIGVPAGDARRRSCGPLPIDHVRVRGFGVRTCRVAVETGDASDHWPVVADLEAI
ncbi:MAG TPA: endonuclease/exonuclease/phosphatase family protein [Candidatus Limnocylindrales bacterium]|nr:endonuclease/exonuclease/phosphatase family protein [Candidatus Limnocylindrales bacterium]